MERCQYFMRGGWGSGSTNSGGAAFPLERPGLLSGWGKRKRPRCVKSSRKKAIIVTASTSSRAAADKVRAATVDGRAVRYEKPCAAVGRRRQSSDYRVLRSLEGNGIRAGGVQQRSSPPEAVNGCGWLGVSPEKGGSSSGSEGAAWPRIEITLTTQEKEEDFMAFKGTKPSLRPKKRTKPVQKSVNLMSPGAWLCDLSLERYEVREKKTSKKRPRGLRAMGNKDSDSE